MAILIASGRFWARIQYLVGIERAAMADPTGEADRGALRLDFDRRLML
jgi:hypothetical protein